MALRVQTWSSTIFQIFITVQGMAASSLNVTPHARHHIELSNPYKRYGRINSAAVRGDHMFAVHFTVTVHGCLTCESLEKSATDPLSERPHWMVDRAQHMGHVR